MNMKLFLARNKPDKLTELYLKSTNNEEKTEILERLLQLQEIQELWTIFNLKKEGSVGKILATIEENNTEKLLEIYIRTDDKDLRSNITNRLVELAQIELLWKTLESHYDEYIWQVLFDLHSSDLNILLRLYEIARTDALQRRLIDRLFELKAKEILHEILFDLQNLGYSEKFIHLIMENPSDIADFFRGSDTLMKQQLATALKQTKTEAQLIELLKQISDKHVLTILREVHTDDFNPEILKLGLDKIDELLFTSGKQSLGEFYRTWDWLFDAIFDISFEFFFTRCNDLQKLHLLLIRYGILELLGEPKTCTYSIDLSNFVHYVPDAEKQGQTDLLSLFDQAWHKVLLNRNKDSVCLACLLSRKRFEQEKARYAQVDDPDEAERKLRHHYKNLKAKAQSQEELDQLVAQEQQDLSRLINKNFYSSLLDYRGSFETPFYIDADYSAYIEPGQGHLIGLRTLSENSILVDDLSAEISKVEVALQQQIFRLTDPKEIVLAKQAAEQQKSRFIAKDDLIFTIAHSEPSDLPPGVMQTALEMALSLGEEASIKAVLHFLSKSKDPTHLELLSPEIYRAYLCSSLKAIGNKSSVRALLLLLSISLDQDLAVRLSGAVGFSPDGRFLATRNKGVFCTRTWNKISELSLPEYFSPDGKYFVSWEDGVFSTRTWKKVADIKNSVCFSPDSRFLVTWNSVYSTKSWTKLATIVHPVGFSSDSRYLASIDAVYETDKWTKLSALHNSVCFSPDGKWLATFNYIYSQGDWKQIAKISSPEFFSPNGNFLVCKDGIYSTAHWGKLADLTGAVCFSASGEYLITTEGIYSTINWSLIKSLTSARSTGNTMFFSPDGRYFASESDLLRTADWSTAIAKIQTVAFSPNSRLFATRNAVYAIGLLFEIKELIMNNLVYYYHHPEQISAAEVLEAIELAGSNSDFIPFVQPLLRLKDKVLALH